MINHNSFFLKKSSIFACLGLGPKFISLNFVFIVFEPVEWVFTRSKSHLDSSFGLMFSASSFEGSMISFSSGASLRSSTFASTEESCLSSTRSALGSCQSFSSGTSLESFCSAPLEAPPSSCSSVWAKYLVNSSLKMSVVSSSKLVRWSS